MEDDRRRNYENLERLFGPEGARAIMSQIPPFPWDELATKTDLADVETRLTDRFSALDERLTGRVDALDGRLGALDERLTGRMDALDERLTGRFDAVDGRLSALDERVTGRIDAMDDKLSGQLATLQAVAVTSRTIVLTMVVAVAAMGALAVALAGLA